MFSSGAVLTGSLDGGSGTDTLDFSGYGSARSTTLLSAGVIDGFGGQDSAIAGSFSNIDRLVGSTLSGDSLKGANLAATFQFGATDTYLSGGSSLGFSGYENLVGGTAADRFAFVGSGSLPAASTAARARAIWITALTRPGQRPSTCRPPRPAG